MKKLKSMFSLIRFELPLAAAICVILGQLFALGYFAPLILTISAAFSVFFISASILVSNDYFDIETDKINAPHRPIPSGLVSPAQALAFAVLLLLSGLILSLTISIAAFLFSMGLTIIGLLYNRKFKKHGLLGNLMVSFSVGMTFVFGGLSVGMPFNKVVLFFGVIAALVDLGEEIAADSMDVKGDKLIDSKSIAIRHGREKALRVSAFIFVFVILLSITPFLLEWFNIVYLIPIIVMDIFIGYSTYRLVRSKDEEGRKYIRLLYIGATFGLVVFLVMRLMGL